MWLRVGDLESRVNDLGLSVSDLVFRVSGLGFRVYSWREIESRADTSPDLHRIEDLLYSEYLVDY